jgi:2-keto-3-deoxy-L-rhamnonate aldolase RhmA
MKYFNQIAPGTAVIPMIESVQGLQNAEDIIKVPGVSGIFVGPVDLRLSMGLKPPFDGTEEVFIQALETIVALGKRYKVPIGIYAASVEVMKRWKRMGFTWFLVAGDTSSLIAGATSVLEGSKTAIRDLKL